MTCARCAKASICPCSSAGKQSRRRTPRAGSTQTNSGNVWIPGPLQVGAPPPLSVDELRELYDTNEQVTREEEVEIDGGPPPIDVIPLTDFVRALIAALGATEPPELTRFWERAPAESEIPVLERLNNAAKAAAELLLHVQPWQRSLIAIGHRGGADVELWTQLASLVDDAHTRAQKAKAPLLQHDPKLPASVPLDQAARVSTRG